MSSTHELEFDSLAALFPTPILPRVLSDSADVIDVYSALGFPCSLFSELRQGRPLSIDAALVILTGDGPPSLSELKVLLEDVAVLWMPLVSFAADRRAVEYSASRLANIDFELACAANSQHLDMFETQRAPLAFVTADCTLRVQLGQDLHLTLPKLQPAIGPSEWVSIAQFIELAMIPNGENDAFVVDGTIECDGASVAHHRATSAQAGPPARRVWELLAAVRYDGGFPLRITVAQSRIVSIQTAGGLELADQLLALTDNMLRGYLTEVSLAGLPPDETVDWFVNSQINEASGGVHVGIGAGAEAAHIDFIASGARVDRGFAPTG